ncbi:MAG TPA: efflux RND transporter periplasmic adaptor subunit [Cyclobacteriaceae bacterium]|nr:efflux RND transporter periplasmic adaptor subunit [Cyclobacteriaceae bacterium]
MKHSLYFFVAFALLAGACGKVEEKKVIDKTPANQITFKDEQLKYIEIDTVRKVPAMDEFTAVGEVSFDENNVVRVYPIVSGSVSKVNASLGDYVKKGQILATILSTDISTYQRDYNIAKANFEVAEANLTRSTELYKSGMLSAKEYADAQKEYSNDHSEFNEKKQILELYGGSEKELDAMFRVVAPRSGYIVERNINEGTQIRTDNATNIFTISDLETIWVWANIHESDMGKVHEGDFVRVKTIAYPDKEFTGTIKKIGTMLDPESRVIRVRTELVNKDGLLKPEMFANVVITPKNTVEVLAVPQSAIVLENNNYYVMKEAGRNVFEKVRIRVGKNYDGYTEVIDGLSEGDHIISEGSLFVLTGYNLK